MTASYEAIAKRAFEIWEREGRPEGRDQEHWFRAERDLLRPTAREEINRVKAAPAPPRSEIEDVNPATKRGVRPAPSRPVQTRSRPRA